jgi:hypothetical protein
VEFPGSRAASMPGAPYPVHSRDRADQAGTYGATSRDLCRPPESRRQETGHPAPQSAAQLDTLRAWAAAIPHRYIARNWHLPLRLRCRPRSRYWAAEVPFRVACGYGLSGGGRARRLGGECRPDVCLVGATGDRSCPDRGSCIPVAPDRGDLTARRSCQDGSSGIGLARTPGGTRRPGTGWPSHPMPAGLGKGHQQVEEADSSPSSGMGRCAEPGGG